MKQIKMRNLLCCSVTLMWTLIGQPSAESSSLEINERPADYCLDESFNPRCLRNEVILMSSAIYGRMRTGRCITEEEVAAHRLLAGEVPGVLGCSANVLTVLDRRCSGSAHCEIRVIDPSLQTVKPCFPGLSVYLQASFECVSVVDEERSCVVAASKNPIHITSNSNSKRMCGTKVQPWIVEAPTGQKVSITLLDFTASSSHPDPEGRSETSCQSHGVIVDRMGKQNTSICGGSQQREKEIYSSAGNQLQIVFNPLDSNENGSKVLLRVAAVGCSDVIPPEDSWLKRNDDTIIIGCYSSRLTWQLSCKGGKWFGVLGNCTLDTSRAVDPVVESEERSTLSESGQVLAIVAIGGFTLAICLSIVCIGAVCLRRFYSESKKQDYKTLNYGNTSSSRVHNVNQMNRFTTDVHGSFVEHQQQQQQQQQHQHQMPTTMYSVYVGDVECNNGDDDLINITDDQSSSARL